MNDYYIYSYIEPDKDEPFYIGKGRGNRSHYHLAECYNNQNTHFYCKLKSMLDKGIQPRIYFFDTELTEEQAFEREIELIRAYGRLDLGTGCLTNHTNGGEGSSNQICSEKLRLERSERMLGNKYSLGNTTWLGREHSIDTKIKMSRLASNRSKEYSDKLKLSHRLKRGIPICSYNLITGEIRKIFLSIKQVKENGYPPAIISSILRYGLYNNTGVGWRYLTPEEKEKYIDPQTGEINLCQV